MGEADTRSSLSNASDAAPEYVIYSFLKHEDGRGAAPWQHMGASNDMAAARLRAQHLFSSDRYSRIELRKKFISEKTGAVMDVPLEVLARNPDRDLRMIMMLLTLAFCCALLALGLSLQFD